MDTGDGFLGLTVGSLRLRRPVFVDPDETVAQAARAMRAARASACLAGSPGEVLGILTERDIAWSVADGGDPGLRVRQLMTARVLGVRQDGLVSEAFLLMIRHAIRKLAVYDANGGVTALLEERDLMAARQESPVALAAAIDTARDAHDLALANQGLEQSLPRWLSQGADAARTGALAAAVRDQIFARAAQLALEQGPDPGPVALAVLGSEGRREQFLATDQDNALILGEGADPRLAGDYARRLMALLAEAGLPPCPHGVTADNPDWRMALPAWREHLRALARNLGEGAVLALSLLADARHVAGPEELTQGLRANLTQALRDHPQALRYMAREAVRFEPPLSVFGALTTLRHGPDVDTLDIKRGGIFPLTQGARVLALDLDIASTNTAQRLRGAAGAGVLAPGTAEDLAQALEFMQELRLRFQGMALAEGREPGNAVAPARISRLERSRLKECFKAVGGFQDLLTNRYGLRLLT